MTSSSAGAARLRPSRGGRERSDREGLQGLRPGLRHPARRELHRGDARGDQELARPRHPVHQRLRSVTLHPQGVHELRGGAATTAGGSVTSSSCAARMCRCGAFWPTPSIRTSSASADPEERRRRIIAAAERRSSAQRPQRRRGRTFVGVPPRIAGFTGRADALDRLDAILTQRQACRRDAGQPGGRAGHGRGRKDLACRRIRPPLPQPL